MNYIKSAVKNIMPFAIPIIPLVATLILGGPMIRDGLERMVSDHFTKPAICIQNNDYAPPIKPKNVPEIEVEEHKKEFLKDSEKILLARMLYGEASIYSAAEKIAIAFTAINRANDGWKFNGESLKGAILSKEKYSCFNKNDINFERVKNAEKHTNKNWKKCLKLAPKILNGKYDKYNFGQTHYHDKDMNPKPFWVKHMKEKLDSTGFAHQYYRGV